MITTRSERRRGLLDLILYAGVMLGFAELLGVPPVQLSLRRVGYTFAVAILWRYRLARSAVAG